MAKQSELERLGIEERKDEFIHSRYNYNEENKYEAGHPDAINDGDVKGKGTGVDLGFAILKDLKKDTHDTAHISYENMNTTNGGGKYDIEGTKGVDKAFQGNAGRDYLSLGGVNYYNPKNQYGPDSVDTTNNRSEGQYVVE